MTKISREDLIKKLEEEFGIKNRKFKKMEMSELAKVYQDAYKARSKKLQEEDNPEEDNVEVSSSTGKVAEKASDNSHGEERLVANNEGEEDRPVNSEIEQKDALPTLEEVMSFQSYCTYEFDPTPNCSCLKSCRLELPEEFKRCSENYALLIKIKGAGKMKVKKTSEGGRKGGGGRVAFHDSSLSRASLFNHNVKSQAALIDHLLEDGIGFTAEGLAELLETKPTRIMAHIQHIKKEHDGAFTKINGYFYLSDRVPPTDRLCHEVKKQKD